MHASLPILGFNLLKRQSSRTAGSTVTNIYKNPEEGFPVGQLVIILDLECGKADPEVVLLIKRLA